jgi:hypothetical protein
MIPLTLKPSFGKERLHDCSAIDDQGMPIQDNAKYRAEAGARSLITLLAALRC